VYASERRKEILKMIRQNGFTPVSQLSELFAVSEVTIRTDLRALEQEGKIERKYGGASLKETDELPFSLSKQLLSNNKERIANAAVQLIKEGDSILLDASTTTYHLAMKMNNMENITIISNSIPVFEQFKEYRSGTLIGIPGTLNPVTQSFIGPDAEKMVGSLRVSKTFITPKGILLEGLRDNSISEASIRKKMIDSAAEVIVLADYSKFNNGVTLFGIDSFDSVTTIVTDREPSEEFRKLFAEKGIRVIISSPIEAPE